MLYSPVKLNWLFKKNRIAKVLEVREVELVAITLEKCLICVMERKLTRVTKKLA